MNFSFYLYLIGFNHICIFTSKTENMCKILNRVVYIFCCFHIGFIHLLINVLMKKIKLKMKILYQNLLLKIEYPVYWFLDF